MDSSVAARSCTRMSVYRGPHQLPLDRTLQSATATGTTKYSERATTTTTTNDEVDNESIGTIKVVIVFG